MRIVEKKRGYHKKGHPRLCILCGTPITSRNYCSSCQKAKERMSSVHIRNEIARQAMHYVVSRVVKKRHKNVSKNPLIRYILKHSATLELSSIEDYINKVCTNPLSNEPESQPNRSVPKRKKTRHPKKIKRSCLSDDSEDVSLSDLPDINPSQNVDFDTDDTDIELPTLIGERKRRRQKMSPSQKKSRKKAAPRKRVATVRTQKEVASKSSIKRKRKQHPKNTEKTKNKNETVEDLQPKLVSEKSGNIQDITQDLSFFTETEEEVRARMENTDVATTGSRAFAASPMYKSKTFVNPFVNCHFNT